MIHTYQEETQLEPIKTERSCNNYPRTMSEKSILCCTCRTSLSRIPFLSRPRSGEFEVHRTFVIFFYVLCKDYVFRYNTIHTPKYNPFSNNLPLLQRTDRSSLVLPRSPFVQLLSHHLDVTAPLSVARASRPKGTWGLLRLRPLETTATGKVGANTGKIEKDLKI